MCSPARSPPACHRTTMLWPLAHTLRIPCGGCESQETASIYYFMLIAGTRLKSAAAPVDEGTCPQRWQFGGGTINATAASVSLLCSREMLLSREHHEHHSGAATCGYCHVNAGFFQIHLIYHGSALKSVDSTALTEVWHRAVLQASKGCKGWIAGLQGWALLCIWRWKIWHFQEASFWDAGKLTLDQNTSGTVSVYGTTALWQLSPFYHAWAHLWTSLSSKGGQGETGGYLWLTESKKWRSQECRRCSDAH